MLLSPISQQQHFSMHQGLMSGQQGPCGHPRMLQAYSPPMYRRMLMPCKLWTTNRKPSGPLAASAGRSEGKPSQQPVPVSTNALDGEIASIAFPMLMALAADPLAGLVDTAFIGHTGAAELAGMGVALSIFNTLTKFLNVPLVSATTTAVAETIGAEQRQASQAPPTSAKRARSSGDDQRQPLLQAEDRDDEQHAGQHPDTGSEQPQREVHITYDLEVSTGGAAADVEQAVEASGEQEGQQHQRQQQHDTANSVTQHVGTAVSAAASASLTMGLCLGVIEAVIIWFVGGWAVAQWGLLQGSPAHSHGTAFLKVRALTVPVTVLMLVMQGIFRGLQDTVTPLKATLATTAINLMLAPLLIVKLGWGVTGAAVAVGFSQVLPTFYLLYCLSARASIFSVTSEALTRLVALVKPSGLLLIRTVAVTCTFALATSTIAKLGPNYAAAHQVALSVWLATTLLADALAVAAQTMLARYAAAGDVITARRAAERCVAAGGVLGLITAALVGLGRDKIAGVFTSDASVLALVAGIMPVLILTQPINMLAFVWDGVLFGASGFKYASFAMAACALPSCGAMVWGSHQAAPWLTVTWVWAGLGILMLARAVSIWVPYKLKLGPFFKLRDAQ